MKTLRKYAVVTLLTFICAFAAFSLIAQTTNSTPTTGGSGPAISPMVAVWNAAVVAVVPLIIAGIKKVWPKIPSVTWPVVAPLVGVAANWLAAKAGVLPQSGWALGALCGAAGVGLREIVDQVKSLSGNTPPPPAPAPAPAPPPPPGT